MENHHLYLVFPWKLVIFHSCLYVYQKITIKSPTSAMISASETTPRSFRSSPDAKISALPFCFTAARTTCEDGARGGEVVDGKSMGKSMEKSMLFGKTWEKHETIPRSGWVGHLGLKDLNIFEHQDGQLPMLSRSLLAPLHLPASLCRHRAKQGLGFTHLVGSWLVTFP